MLQLRKVCLMAGAAFLGAILGTATLAPCVAQERGMPQTDGVDNSKMGAYRALAQHTYFEFQRGDIMAAAQLARSLERVWDKAEDYGGDMALHKTKPDLFEEIDKAMDEFVMPLEAYKSKPPEAAKVKAAFNNYLEKLKLAD
ncbi:MAG TPA: hypothetical protein VJN93_11870 [Candidatus Acidoferrum sp.]|nr:hypothetical protein [Candidatus Acidoferrum sp.]